MVRGLFFFLGHSIKKNFPSYLIGCTDPVLAAVGLSVTTVTDFLPVKPKQESNLLVTLLLVLCCTPEEVIDMSAEPASGQIPATVNSW